MRTVGELLLMALVTTLTIMWSIVRLKLAATELSYRELLLSIQPAPGQCWMHDTGKLYVLRVDPAGVLWSFQHPFDPAYRPQQSSRLDSWDEWRQRLTHRQMVLQRERWDS